jgi:hypothetical protein
MDYEAIKNLVGKECKEVRFNTNILNDEMCLSFDGGISVYIGACISSDKHGIKPYLQIRRGTWPQESEDES